MNNFLFKTPFLNFFWDLVKRYVFKRLTKSAMPIFVKGGDDIASTMALGYHEDYLIEFLKSKTDNGLNEFLIDIGANIGIISCQIGKHFKEVHMFEPNPLVLKVLEVNCSLMLDDNFQIHPYGLSNKSGTFSLTVPKNNWGGAYIESKMNTYSSEILAAKDGFDTYDSKNYLFLDIKVRDVESEMSKLFSSLKSRGLTRGCFKVDVEGYEEIVMEGILKAIPNDFEVVVILESWGPQSYKFLFEEPFNERVLIGRLGARKEWITNWKWIKAIQLIIRGSYQYSYKNTNTIEGDGNLIVYIKKVSSD